MQLKLRTSPLITALAGAAVFAAACSGTSNSLSPTAPSGMAANAASGSAVSGAMVDECEAVSRVAVDEEEPPPPDPCDPPPPPPGDEGCTPGYWKNHLGAWGPTGLGAGDDLNDIFGAAALDGTLLDALNFGGGGGITGAKQILLRAAVAALLNATHPGVAYPRTPEAIDSDVTAALGSNSRAAMLSLAASLDADNNLGCPLGKTAS